MFSPRAYTIILITFDCVARIDLRSGDSARVVRSSRVNRSTHGPLGDAVRAAVGMLSAKCGRTYVLTDELWSGHVSLADDIVRAVAEDQLEQTLALEAEYESGISPFDSRLAYSRPAAARGPLTWWVTQAESAQIESVAAAMGQAEGRLAGIASVVFPGPSPDDADQQIPDTTTTEACEAFAQSWLAGYLTNKVEVPVIGMTSQSWTAKHQRRISIFVAAVVMVVCAGAHYRGTVRLAKAHAGLASLVDREARIRTELGDREERARQIHAARQQRQADDAMRAEQLDQLRRRQSARAAERKRPVELLRALAATTDPAHWIQHITLGDESAVISGVAIDSTSVTRLAKRLEAELGPAQWHVRAAELSVSDSMPLIGFEIAIVPRDEAALPFDVAQQGAIDVR